MTVSQPRSQCTTSGTVAAPHFHFYVGWKGPLAFLVVDWILVEELTNEHTPQIWYFANPQGSNGFPQGCSMLPVSDPQNWRWMTWNFPMTAGFWMHNSPYRVTVQWRYWVQMKGQRGPFQTSIEVNVQNLVVTSGDVGKVLKWDPERPELCDTSFGYSITCAQRKQVQVKISIYSMDGAKVYELTEQKICPGSYSFTWNGSMSMGQYGGGYQGEGPTNVAPSGLYTFDVEVTGSTYYHDADWLRSKELRVVPGPVEYYGYDDGGTPEDESDDNHLYYLRWYALYSGRDATWGEIWLYDPDFERVGSWAVPMLSCVVHGWNDGLEANPSGEVHGVIIPVPVSVMEKAGTYRFVLHFYDDFADSYKNHQVKAALEVNAYVQSVYEVYPCICPDKVHYPDVGRNDCHCYANKLKCDDCPAFRNYCPARTSTGAGHPKCQCKNYRACQPRDCSLCHAIRSRLGNVYNSPGYVQARGYGQ
ncbi:MAG: hypothetical protein RMK94_16805, partial [Armatimonadota bacterium]|nr:hypothetical protein [Armatimonadota bacterium]